jgi:S-adenosylmethionine:tRNA ribosyltransferase-isomerase
MRTDLFDFALPEDRIAAPASPRDVARLWSSIARAAQLEDRLVRDLPELLRAARAMVVNDTKVIPAFLHGRRIGRGEYEPGISAT